MAIQLADDRNVARGGTTAMAASALGISLFDLLLRGNGNGGLFGGIGNVPAGGVVMHDTAKIAALEVATAKDKEIAHLEIENSTLKTGGMLVKQQGEIDGLRKDLNHLYGLIDITAAWKTAPAPAAAA